MIPNGLNPHGLEKRELRFHIYNNGAEEIVSTFETSLYCYATFPPEIMSTYGSGWALQPANSEEEFARLPKYTSRELAGNHIMVHGDVDLYYCLWSSDNIPGFGTVYILDTSGSMTGADYTQAKYAITAEVDEYNCIESGTDTAHMFLVDGTYANNVSTNNGFLGKLNLGQSPLNKTYEAVSAAIDGIKRAYGSEAMLTCLYYSILKIHDYVYGDNDFKIGSANKCKAFCFLLLTDESIFSFDSLYGYDAINTEEPEPPLSNWFYQWQRYSTNKFPYKTITELKNLTFDKKREFCQGITDALRQMSYYYGVNMSWGIYGGWGRTTDKRFLIDFTYRHTYYPGTGFFLNAVESIGPNSDDEWTITWEDADMDGWETPAAFHVDYPHSPMFSVVLRIPKSLVAEGQQALKSDCIMGNNDQFDIDKVLSKWHSDGESNEYYQYCAFRFHRYNGVNDHPVKLPSTSQMNLQPGRYSWHTTHVRYEQKWFDCQTSNSYTVDNLDLDSLQLGAQITFTLAQM